MIGGMDEAGRGPAIGPLVIGLVILTEDQRKDLKDQGVNDSKKLTKEKREMFKTIIEDMVEVAETLVIPAVKIDSLRDEMTLNEIEIEHFRKLLAPHSSKISELQLDAADVNAERFGSRFSDLINGKIDSRHKGDSIFLSVGAASIIAKVERDRQVAQLQREMDEKDPDLPSFGSGYPTQAKPFLQAFVKKYHSLPIFARQSWKTCKDAMEEYGHVQKDLSDYL